MSDSSFNFQAVTADPAWKIGIVKSKWNHEIVNMLASEVVKHLEASGIKLIEIFEVPGSWELISGAQKLISKCDLIIPLGVVIRGETTHYESVCQNSANSISKLGLKGICIGNGILNVENYDQAISRADPNLKNFGGNAAIAALTLVEIKQNRMAK